MLYKIALLVFITILTSSCNQKRDSQSADACKYGAPQPIFNPTQAGLSGHEFSRQGNDATEQIRFDNGETLTVLQSGCNEIRQEFQFGLLEQPLTDSPAWWIAQAVNEMRRLSSFGPDYQAFAAWAAEIEERAETIKLAEAFELQRGFFVRIDRIASTENATLVLTLSDAP
ncbi:MAG TPA: hypothetical protein PKC76_07280 [Saprospiraceae bacterium]|nr:hypothetical protein [Saprospiraceae bacterium]HMP23914.1 hypothetical protein [Saprospiraceae bacterium]